MKRNDLIYDIDKKIHMRYKDKGNKINLYKILGYNPNEFNSAHISHFNHVYLYPWMTSF